MDPNCKPTHPPTNKNGSAWHRFLCQLEIDTRMLAMIGALLLIWLILNKLTGGHIFNEHWEFDFKWGTFLKARNLYNLAVQSSVVAIMATGMVLVIVARHIDLSVGSVMGFTGMVIAYLQVEQFPLDAAWNWPTTVLCGLLLGAIVGLWQGWWIAYRGVPAFVVTLAGLLIFRGAAYLVTDGRTVAPLNKTYQLLGGGIDGSIGAAWSWVFGGGVIALLVLSTLYKRMRRKKYNFATKPLWAEALLLTIGIGLVAAFVLVMNSYYKPRTEIPRGIPVPVLILIFVVFAMSLLARVTKFGRYVFAIGGNPEAAELSGINVKKVTMLIFMVMGLLCGIAAVITTARLNSGANSMGVMAELSVIAAAVIGGTSLAGGLGTITGAILGAVIMQSLQNGMVLLGAGSAEQQVVIGSALIIAVWFDVVYNRNRR